MQRPPLLGDWTICQDKETTKNSIRVNSIDSANKLNILDWAIADFSDKSNNPYLYVPNRVYAMDTVILKPTLEGLMPIPENLDGNCYFETASSQTVLIAAQAAKYTCSMTCPKRWPPTSCKYYSYTTTYSSPTCPYYSGGVMLPLAIGIRGTSADIDIRIVSKSAFEYLDIRITDWPRQSTTANGITVAEHDAMGWPAGESPGENFEYQSMGNNIFRIWAWPGGGRNGRWGPYGTNVRIRVHFTLLGGPDTETIFPNGSFSGAQRNVTVSYVGAGRRGNHR